LWTNRFRDQRINDLCCIAPFKLIDQRGVILLLCASAITKERVREGVVAISMRNKRSPYGMACPECNDLLIAPDSSEYVSKHEVRHFWRCDNCGNRSEIVGDPRIDFTRKPSTHVGAPLSPVP
jgi:RNase P subunit RPR2